jgi:hypothetical protein
MMAMKIPQIAKAKLTLDKFQSLTTPKIRAHIPARQQGEDALTCTFTLGRSFDRKAAHMSTG